MGRIAQQTLEEIAAANDIVDVVGAYFPLKRAGALWKALCPFHQEKTPSFSVNPQRQIFKCFGCGAGGGVFKFVEMYDHVSFPDAVKKLAERAGIRLIEEELSDEDDRRFRMRKRLLALHAEAADWFHQSLLRTAAAAPAREYLQKRGVNSEIAKAWKLGYAPEEWDACGAWAQARHFTREELIASGLVKTREDAEGGSQPSTLNSQLTFYDRFRGRIMFPIFNDMGEVIGFSGRLLAADAQAAKYINSPETILFTKGNVLYGLHRSKRPLVDTGVAIVCEGQLDLITAFESGVHNVIAPQGTAFTEKQAHILKRFVREVVLCFDADAAGQKAAERSLPSLLGADLGVRVAALPAGHDPDSFIRAEGAEAFRQFCEQAPDFFDFQLERHLQMPATKTARGRTDLARKLAGWVSLLTDPIMRETWINLITARLEFSAPEFRALLAKPGSASRQTASSESGADEVQPTVTLSATVALLCQLALQDGPSRDWLPQARPRTPVEEGELDLLRRVIEGKYNPGQAASVTAFLATLPAGEQAALSALLPKKLPSEPARVLEDCWLDLERRAIRQRRDVILSRLRLDGLSSEEIAALQKEYRDLSERSP